MNKYKYVVTILANNKAEAELVMAGLMGEDDPNTPDIDWDDWEPDQL